MAQRKRVSADSSANNSVKKPRGKSFAEGNPYRWRSGQSGNPKGRPTKHEHLEEFIRSVGTEEAKDGLDWSLLYAMVRGMYLSRSAADHKELLEHGWGKVPQDIRLDVRRMSDDQLISIITGGAGDEGGSGAGAATAGQAAHTDPSSAEPHA